MRILWHARRVFPLDGTLSGSDSSPEGLPNTNILGTGETGCKVASGWKQESDSASQLSRPWPFLQVWLEAGRDGQVFTYANSALDLIQAGDLVRVRLQGRPHVGLVVEGLDQLPPLLQERNQALEPVLAVLQPAAVAEDWQQLLQAVAAFTHTSPFRVLHTALPPGWLGQRAGTNGLGRRLQQVQCTDQANDPTQLAPLRPRQRQLLEHLRHQPGPQLLRDLCGPGGFSRAHLRDLEARGLVQLQTVRLPAGRTRPEASAAPDSRPGRRSDHLEPPQALTTAQADAVAAIRTAAPGTALLLWGVTGSGKTEVYLHAAATSLAQGHSVLLLTPEIGLIPQLLDRCRRRFGSLVLEYHSGLSDRERVMNWRLCLEAAATDQPLLAVGTRSAVFLPLNRLDLIVLDEEHDRSYKQTSPMPCYQTAEVARLRGQLSGARLVLGSATPSLETWQRCQVGGDTRLLRLPERIGARPLPPVRLVDMRHELAEGHRRLLSRPLLDRLQNLAQRGEQAVVLVPRRGYHAFLSCRSCGQAVLCPHCDVAMTVHQQRDRPPWLRCHWCDTRQMVDQRCSHCGSTAFRPFGAGTQRVADQLDHDLEGLRVLRFDQDTTRGRDGHRRVLERFAAGEADVLVGTQMLAKGMDLPRVTLAAVLAADGLLHRPDLRSAEHCLQLLLQLAGRAGRGEWPGEVLVQTYSPDHPVLQHLVDGRYGRFLDEELAQRHRTGLVPFSRACLLRLAGPSASLTATAASSLAEHIRPGLEAAGWLLIGPAPAPVARVAGRSRWQLLLHGPAPLPATVPPPPLPLAPELELRALLPRTVTLTIDPDPLEL